MISIEYFYNTNGEVIYYEYEEEYYTPTFPIDWAMNHIEGTGPKECGNCKHYGSWDNIFLGYCINCAKYTYQDTRGTGFISTLKEYDEENPRSANSTYLQTWRFKMLPHLEEGTYLEQDHELHLCNDVNHATFDSIGPYYTEGDCIQSTECNMCKETEDCDQDESI